MALGATMGIYETLERISNSIGEFRKRKDTLALAQEQFVALLWNMAPLIISTVLIAPFVMFCETFSTAAKISEYYHSNFDSYKSHIERIWHVLRTQEYLYVLLIVHAVCFILWVQGIMNRSTAGEKNLNRSRLFRVSFFMTLFAVIFSGVISEMPFFWERYFIVLQPVSMLIILIDVVIIIGHINNLAQVWMKFALNCTLAGTMVILLLAGSDKKIQYLNDYLYQINNQYKGPLDYIIPYVQENYKKPDSLILATNYEELSYVYYLDCKVILGFVNKNLPEDLKYQPDIVVFRRHWGQDPAIYNQILSKVHYKEVEFPVYDLLCNDISELDFVIEHQFKTVVSSNPADDTQIYIRQQ